MKCYSSGQGMILYDLHCKTGHEFEAWFRDSTAYDRQRKSGSVLCPICGDKKVEKAMMAPAVSKGRSGESEARAPATPPEAAKLAEAMKFLRHLRSQVEANCDNVGPRFAEEARRIHYREVEPRGIYGEASKAESEALKEEGIEFGELPWVPQHDS